MNRMAVFFLVCLAPILALVLALLGLETVSGNFLGWLLLAFGIAYPAATVIQFWIRKESFWQPRFGGRAIAEEIGDSSFWLILPGMMAGFFAPPLEYIYLPAVLPRSLWMQLIGLALIALAMGLRIWTRRTIKSRYSGHVQVTTDHQLVQQGPYRFIRHPGYAGYFLFALGICIGYSSLIGLAAIPFLMLPGFVHRMNLEERLLAASFGDQFTAYASRTRRLLPWVW